MAGITSETQYSVKSLTGGVTYVFVVQTVDSSRPQCHSDMSASTLVTTIYDEDAAPRDLALSGTFMSEKIVGVATVSLRWRSPRDRPESLGYYIFFYVNGTDSGEAEKMVVKETNRTEVSFNVTNLASGESYVFFVTTAEKKGRHSDSILVTTARYQAPRTFRYIRDLDRSAITLIWEPSPDTLSKELGYAVFLLNVSDVRPTAKTAEQLEELEKEDSFWKCVGNTSSQSFDLEKLGADKVYGVTVSVGYYKGHHGAFAQKEFVNFTVKGDNGPQPPGPPSANKGSVTAWVIVGIAGVVILVLLLVVALAYFVIRHQQLQRSFMSFANSHYDTRSGTATFNPEENTTDLGSEEEDQPIIRGFSDDEPLVVA